MKWKWFKVINLNGIDKLKMQMFMDGIINLEINL